MPRRLAAFLTLALVALSLSAGARASSLCVLYFDNNTGDTSWDPLKKGLADSVDWAKVDAFKPYGGIRIEDDVVCTEDAPLNLTRETWSETA